MTLSLCRGGGDEMMKALLAQGLFFMPCGKRQ